MNFFDADRLTGNDLAEIDFLLAQTDTPATGDHDRFILEGIVDCAYIASAGFLLSERDALFFMAVRGTLAGSLQGYAIEVTVNVVSRIGV